MLGRLAEAVDEVDIPIDGDVIAEALALRDRLDSAVAAALSAFDEAKLWELDGARSLTDWIRVHGRCSRADASRLSAAARRTRSLPVTMAAWRDGALSSGQVRAVTANLDDRTVEVFAGHEADLVPTFVPLTVRETVVAMQHWKERLESEDRPEPEDPERSVFLSETLAGRFKLDGDLDPIGGHVLVTALRLAGSDDFDPDRTPAHRRADAMVDIAQFFLDHHQRPPGSRHRPHLNVVVDIDHLADHTGVRFADGGPVDAATAGALTCDSVLSRVMAAGSTILDFGRTTRVISPALWNALLLRDRHCRFDRCEVPGSRCDAHHVIPWEHGGETSLTNLTLECRGHHRTLHKPGWSAKLLPDGTFEVTDPTGRTRTSRPPGPAG